MEKFIRMGVDYLGFLSKQLGDLRGIATLAYELRICNPKFEPV